MGFSLVKYLMLQHLGLVCSKTLLVLLSIMSCHLRIITFVGFHHLKCLILKVVIVSMTHDRILSGLIEYFSCVTFILILVLMILLAVLMLTRSWVLGYALVMMI